ncbi:hypothetical protein [Nocardia jejuensis]|uniref:hypothetical protein n=1 Tax=Nocardia jejuensis TaxID=328049 RepID=UPI00157C5B5F|nr:hypothetical protein [Nocardia jejuensis]
MISLRTALRATYVTVAAVLTVLILIPQIRLYHDEQPASEVVAQLRFLRGELDSGAAERMQEQFPEGYFFSYVLYGLAWTDLARADPGRREEALRESRWALTRTESASGRAVFDARLTPAYGVFYVGWSSRLRGAVVELAGAGAPETARFTADCEALAAAFTANGPFLQAYPRQAWPVDNVVAVAALRMHDRVVGPRFGAVIEQWLSAARAQLDPSTGLLPHQVLPATDGARGSSQAVIQRFLPEIDSRWAGEQYAAFRRAFVDAPFGLTGVREYPRGTHGTGDVDSGPLISGISLSATAVALGAARANGDRELGGSLTALGETFGAPVTFGGSKRYALGVLPIGDAFLAWSFATPAGPAATSLPTVTPWWWRLPWHLLAVVILTLLWLPMIRDLRRRWAGPVPRPRRGRCGDSGNRVRPLPKWNMF